MFCCPGFVNFLMTWYVQVAIWTFFSVWEMMLDMKASWDGSDWNIWETSRSFCLDYEESLEQFGSPWISRGKEFTSKTECVALHVCYVINTSFSSFEFFWRYGWIIPIVHIIVHQHHPMCAWSNRWNSWTSMNFSSLGMGIRIAMFAEIFFGGETIVVEKLRPKCSIFWRTFHRRRPRCWDVRRRM